MLLSTDNETHVLPCSNTSFVGVEEKGTRWYKGETENDDRYTLLAGGDSGSMAPESALGNQTYPSDTC